MEYVVHVEALVRRRTKVVVKATGAKAAERTARLIVEGRLQVRNKAAFDWDDAVVDILVCECVLDGD